MAGLSPYQPERSSARNSTVTIGGGFCNILFFILLVLKLTGNFDYSWWIVTAPLWGPIVLVLTICLLLVVGFILYGFCIEALKQLKR